MNEIIIILGKWFHLLGTVIWIGAMILLLFVIIPSAKEVFGSTLEFKKLLKSVGKRMTFLVNISIIIIIMSGILLAVSGRNLEIKEEHSFRESLIYISKIVLASIMVIIHFSRNKIIAPILEKMASKDPTSKSLIRLQKIQIDLVWVNLTLGLIVMFLSVML